MPGDATPETVKKGDGDVQQRLTYPRIVPVGLNGFLVQFSGGLNETSNRAALAFKAAIDQQAWRGIEETSSTLASSFLRFDTAALTHSQMRARLTELLEQHDWYQAALPRGRRLFMIPCAFDAANGPQLSHAAELAGMDRATAIQSLTAAPLRVMAIGYAPGQPYAGELPPAWDIPRMEHVNPKVPGGALVVAIRQVIIFAADNPTGWRHVGQTAFQCFRPQQPDNPFALRPGDELQLQSVSAEQLFNLKSQDHSGLGGAVIRAL